MTHSEIQPRDKRNIQTLPNTESSTPETSDDHAFTSENIISPLNLPERLFQNPENIRFLNTIPGHEIQTPFEIDNASEFGQIQSALINLANWQLEALAHPDSTNSQGTKDALNALIHYLNEDEPKDSQDLAQLDIENLEQSGIHGPIHLIAIYINASSLVQPFVDRAPVLAHKAQILISQSSLQEDFDRHPSQIRYLEETTQELDELKQKQLTHYQRAKELLQEAYNLNPDQISQENYYQALIHYYGEILRARLLDETPKLNHTIFNSLQENDKELLRIILTQVNFVANPKPEELDTTHYWSMYSQRQLEDLSRLNEHLDDPYLDEVIFYLFTNINLNRIPKPTDKKTKGQLDQRLKTANAKLYNLVIQADVETVAPSFEEYDLLHQQSKPKKPSLPTLELSPKEKISNYIRRVRDTLFGT